MLILLLNIKKKKNPPLFLFPGTWLLPLHTYGTVTVLVSNDMK